MNNPNKNYIIHIFSNPTTATGHFAIGIEGPDKKFLGSIPIAGKYPKNRLMALSGPGIIKDDSDMTRTREKRPNRYEKRNKIPMPQKKTSINVPIQVTKKQALQAIALIEAEIQNPSDYKLASDNCVTFVNDILEKVGTDTQLKDLFEKDVLDKIGKLPINAGSFAEHDMTEEERKEMHQEREAMEKLHDQGASLDQPKDTIIGGSGQDILSDHITDPKIKALADQIEGAEILSLDGAEIPLVPEALHHEDVKDMQATLIRNPNMTQKQAVQDTIQQWYKLALPGKALQDEFGRILQPKIPERPTPQAALLKNIPPFKTAAKQQTANAKDHLKEQKKLANLAKKAKNVPLPSGGTLAKAEKKAMTPDMSFSFDTQKEQTVNKDKVNTYSLLEEQRKSALDEQLNLAKSQVASPLTQSMAQPTAQADKIKSLKDDSALPQLNGDDLGAGLADIAEGQVLGGMADVSKSFREFAPEIKGINTADALSDGLDAAQQFKSGNKLGGALSLVNTGLGMYQDYQKFQNMTPDIANAGATSGGTNVAGGAAAARVICTELHSQGLMDNALYQLDVDFTKRCLSQTTIRGYHLWAIPLVKQMRQKKWLTQLVQPLATWRAEEIAYLMGERDTGNLLGKIIRTMGEPICYLLGLFCRDKNWKSLYA